MNLCVLEALHCYTDTPPCALQHVTACLLATSQQAARHGRRGREKKEARGKAKGGQDREVGRKAAATHRHKFQSPAVKGAAAACSKPRFGCRHGSPPCWRHAASQSYKPASQASLASAASHKRAVWPCCNQHQPAPASTCRDYQPAPASLSTSLTSVPWLGRGLPPAPARAPPPAPAG